MHPLQEKDYGDHEFRVRMQGGTKEELFPFVTERAARVCLKAAPHTAPKLVGAWMERRKGKQWIELAHVKGVKS